MALPTTYSCFSAAALSVLTFAAMQLFKDQLATEGKMTILGGFAGSWFFVFLLTAVGNAESLLFGSGHQTKLFPEVLICLLASMFVSGLVHRVCATTCLIFSLVALYFLNRVSSSIYSPNPSPTLQLSTNKGTQPKSSSVKGKSRH